MVTAEYSRQSFCTLQFYFLIPGVCVFITAVPITKLFAWGEGDSGRHVLRDPGLRDPGLPDRCKVAFLLPSPLVSRPRRRPTRRRASPAPLFAQTVAGWLGWADILLDVIGGGSSALRGDVRGP